MGGFLSQVSTDTKENINKIVEGQKEITEKTINGVKYVVEKVTDTLGNTVVKVYRDTVQGLTLVYTDTERNIMRTLNNTQLLLTNAYIKTEEDIIYGLRSPIEKTIHLIDNHMDQWEQILNNAIINAFDIGNFMLWMIFIIILIFFVLYGKEVIIKIVDLVKSFNLSFK